MSFAVLNEVTGGGENSGTAVTSLAASSFASTSGNAILVFVRYFAGTPTGVTDTAGNTYTKVNGASGKTHNGIATYLATNITGNAANVVTASASPGLTFCSIHALEVQGVATSGAVDVSDYLGSSTAAATYASNSYSTAQANEIVFTLVTINGGSSVLTEKVGSSTATVATQIKGDGVAVNTVTFYVIESTTQSGITSNGTNDSSNYDIATVSLLATGGIVTTPSTFSVSDPTLSRIPGVH